MKALTLWRPWSDAIVRGPKRVENRTWEPPDSALGSVIAIHAGQTFDKVWCAPTARRTGWTPPARGVDSPKGIVGVARLHDARASLPMRILGRVEEARQCS